MKDQKQKGLQLKVPYIDHNKLSSLAVDLLADNGHLNEVPINIEKLCEQLGVSILPLPGLYKSFGIDSYITDAMRVIAVDEKEFLAETPRLRFSIAHELSHAVLHKGIYSQFEITDIADYRYFQEAIGSDIEKRIESQAYGMAGCLLMPDVLLHREIEARANGSGGVENLGVSEAFQVVRELAELFEVSPESLIKQLKLFAPQLFKAVTQT